MLVSLFIYILPFVLLTAGMIVYMFIRNRWLRDDREFDFRVIAVRSAFVTAGVSAVALLLIFSGGATELLGILGNLIMYALVISVFPTFLMSIFDWVVLRGEGNNG